MISWDQSLKLSTVAHELRCQAREGLEGRVFRYFSSQGKDDSWANEVSVHEKHQNRSDANFNITRVHFEIQNTDIARMLSLTDNLLKLNC